MTNSQKLGVRIKSRRKLQKLTQQQVADVVGVTKSAISKFESGLSLPSLRVMQSMSQLFNFAQKYHLALTEERLEDEFNERHPDQRNI